MINTYVIFLLGCVAGFIDSIAGGGGLITLPTLAIAIGPGALAIGTNKIAGTCGALVALAVYARAKHLVWKSALPFALCVAAGSFLGSLLTPHLPREIFRWMLLITCPLILWTVYHKDIWIKHDQAAHHPTNKNPPMLPIILSGLICGFYDGAWGPGGGTFMLLSLVFWVKLPLLIALAASKLANSLSAISSLLSYSASSNVLWREGIVIAAGVCVGAFTGANIANKKAAKAVRPMLALLAVMLLAKILFF